MHDIRAIRADPSGFNAAMARRGLASIDDHGQHADYLVGLDQQRRNAIADSETLRAEQNRVAKAIGQAKAKGGDVAALMIEAATLKATEGNRAEQAATAEAELNRYLEAL